MILLGLSGLHHDAAAAVIDDKSGDILFAAHSERYSRRKNDPFLCGDLVADVKRFGPERAIWYEEPRTKGFRRALHFDFSFRSEQSPREHLRKLGIDLPLEYVSHHESHAAAGAFTSAFDDAAVLVMDAIGEFETTSIWSYRDGHLKRVFARRYPQSIGLFYSAFTQAIGLKPNEEEYILMGLSAYGSDIAYADVLSEAIDLGVDFPVVKRNYHYGVGHDGFSKYAAKDIAWATQRVYEAVFERVLVYAKRLTGSANLVLMGGCALNCLANRLIRKHFDAWWVMPNPGDAGSSLGAAAVAAGRRLHWRTPYLGTTIPGEYPIAAALDGLLRNECIAVASGRTEFGPRALGNRSLFADPRGERTKCNVNLIKKRQDFRPFAPVVMLEHFAEHFETEGDRECPYMQCVYRIKHPDLFPAITHADGTSRVQTVSREQHPELYDLLARFHSATGCPMLLNTSLNIKGMPLVNDENDARRFSEAYGVPVYGLASA